MKRNIAFFDFDGTITRSDTMLELVKFAKGKAGFMKGMLMLSPWLVAMRAGLISNQDGKEKFLKHFFGNTLLEEFNNLCTRFCSEKLPGLIRTDALEKIREHKADGVEVVVVSASAYNWVKPWCDNMQISALCSELEIAAGKLTGKLKGENCNEAEKVNRIVIAYNPADYEIIYAYGDSSGDKQMLELATDPHYRLFIS